MSSETIAVVGASLAGLRGIEALRRHGHDGPIVAIGAEAHLPYDRPPLSKQFLRGEWGEDRLALRREGVADLDVEWRLGTAAKSMPSGSSAWHISTNIWGSGSVQSTLLMGYVSFLRFTAMQS